MLCYLEKRLKQSRLKETTGIIRKYIFNKVGLEENAEETKSVYKSRYHTAAQNKIIM